MRCDHRFLFFAFSCLLLLLNSVVAWEQADYEIFDLVDELERLVGDKENFYTLLGVERNANQKEIIKGYRKQSLLWHPDKNKSPDAQKRQKLIGVVANILRDEESRTRYDFFLQNGVPKWRGTGYYYRRHRPGLGSVVIGCFVFASFLQYLASWVLCIRRRSMFRELVAEEAEALLRKVPRMSKKRAALKESTSELDQSDAASQSGRSTPVPAPKEPLNPDNDPIVQFPAPRVADVMIIQLPRLIFNGILSLPYTLINIATGKKKNDGNKTSNSDDEDESDYEIDAVTHVSKRKRKEAKDNANDQENIVKKANASGKKAANRRLVNRRAVNPKFVPPSPKPEALP